MKRLTTINNQYRDMKNLFTVEGKVIVITGATGILGQSMVQHFAEQGPK